MNLIVIAICLVGLNSGDSHCYDTTLESRAYIDCVDDPAAPPIGNAERGSGFIRWGSRFGDEFEESGQAVYDASGWQIVRVEGSTTYVRAILFVDEDKVSADGLERECRAGWF